jgi:hypothetical protein
MKQTKKMRITKENRNIHEVNNIEKNIKTEYKYKNQRCKQLMMGGKKS